MRADIAPRTGLSDVELDALLARARTAERQGRVADAQVLLTIVLSELIAAGHWVLYPFEWMARLETELGEYAGAEKWLQIGRDLAAHEGRAAAVFHMDLALARNMVEAGDLAAAERWLAEIPAAIGPPPPIAGPAERVVAWIAGLQLDEDGDAAFARAGPEAWSSALRPCEGALPTIRGAFQRPAPERETEGGRRMTAHDARSPS